MPLSGACDPRSEGPGRLESCRIATTLIVHPTGDGVCYRLRYTTFTQRMMMRAHAPRFESDDLVRLYTEPGFAGVWAKDVVRAFRKVLNLVANAADEQDPSTVVSSFEKLKGKRIGQKLAEAEQAVEADRAAPGLGCGSHRCHQRNRRLPLRMRRDKWPRY